MKKIMMLVVLMSVFSVEVYAKKSAPCVTWYGTCQKSDDRDYPYHPDGSHTSFTSAKINFEVLQKDGTIVEQVYKVRFQTDKWGAAGMLFFGIPNAAGYLSEKYALAAGCRSMKKELNARLCK